MDPEYAKLMGATATQGKSAMPGPLDVGKVLWQHLNQPFYDKGPNDKGVGIQLGYSLARVLTGYLLAVNVSDPDRIPDRNLAIDEQGTRSVHPGAETDLAARLDAARALHHQGDSNLSANFRDLHPARSGRCRSTPPSVYRRCGRNGCNVARTLEVGPIRRAFTVILPAAAPTILTGMRISIGIAWLVIVAAEMLVGGTGIGYFVWNEWNNLSIVNVINAILLIGIVGMVLDQILAYCQHLVTFPE